MEEIQSQTLRSAGAASLEGEALSTVAAIFWVVGRELGEGITPCNQLIYQYRFSLYVGEIQVSGYIFFMGGNFSIPKPKSINSKHYTTVHKCTKCTSLLVK